MKYRPLVSLLSVSDLNTEITEHETISGTRLRPPVLFSIVMIIVNITVMKVIPVGVMVYCSGRSQRYNCVVHRTVSSNVTHYEVNKSSTFPLSSLFHFPHLSPPPIFHLFLLFLFVVFFCSSFSSPLFLLFPLFFFVVTSSSPFSSYPLSLLPTLPLRPFIFLIFLLYPIFLLFLPFFVVV